MPYIFIHHARRWGVWALGLALIASAGCKSSGDSGGWKFPTPWPKKPAAESSATDAPAEPKVAARKKAGSIHDSNAFGGAAESAAISPYPSPTDSQVVLTSGVEGASAIRAQDPASSATPAVAHSKTADAAPQFVAMAPANDSPTRSDSAPATASRSGWIDPWAAAEPIPPGETNNNSVGFGATAAASTSGSLDSSPIGSSRRGREGEMPLSAAPSSPTTAEVANDSQRIYDWSVAPPRNEALEPARETPVMSANPLLAMVLANRRPHVDGITASPPVAAPANAPPQQTANFAPNNSDPPVAPTQVASIAPNEATRPDAATASLVDPAESAQVATAAQAAPTLNTRATAALLRPDGCRAAAPAVDPVVDLVSRSQAKFAQVRNYEARMTWKLSGATEPNAKNGHVVNLSCRTQPRAISADWSPDAAAKKWLYTEDAGQASLMQSQTTDFGRVLMSVRPTDTQALAVHRRPINEWGLESLLDEVAQAVELRDAGAANVSYGGKMWREDCQAEVEQLVVAFPGRAGRIEYYLDSKTSLPVMVISRDAKGGVREFEHYANLKVNVGALDSPLAFNADAILRR